MNGVEVRSVATPYGDGRLHLHPADQAQATLLLGHGAGRGVDTADLQALARLLPPQGFTVALFDQPWVLAGRRVASPPATLDVGLAAAARALSPDDPGSGRALVVGGRSAGARSAARSATALGAVGCLALAFPLHPPGRPERSRVAELTGAGVPTLVVQGERDPFGTPEEFPPDTELAVVPRADHSFGVPARGAVSPEDALAVVVQATVEWLVRIVA